MQLKLLKTNETTKYKIPTKNEQTFASEKKAQTEIKENSNHSNCQEYKHR